MCLLFHKRTADVLTPSLTVVFRLLVHLSSFQIAGDRPVPFKFRKVRRPPLLPITEPISRTSVLSKVIQHLMSVDLGQFVKRSGVLPTTLFAYRKCLGTCDALLCMSHTLQSALKKEQDRAD